MIRIVRHRHGAPALDITDRVELASARNAVRHPWGTVSLTMVAPVSRLGGIVARGDVLVVADGDDALLGWGIVPSQSQRHAAGQSSTMRDRDVTAVSWLDYLGDVDIVRALGRTTSVGTMFNMNDWGRILTTSEARQTGDIGPVVAAVVKELARVKIPETLGGGAYGDRVQVVYDEETALGFGLEVTVDPVLGPSIGGFQTSMPLGGMALAMIMAGVGGDPRMVEMYPTAVWDSASSNDLAKSLGMRPILLHRLAPWRHEAVLDWEIRFKERVYRNAPIGSTPAVRDAATAAKFSAITWPTARSFFIPRDEVYSINRTETTSPDYNAIAVRFPNAPDCDVRFSEEAGLPIIVPEAVNRYGLRLCDVHWPFYTGSDADQSLILDSRYIYGLGWQAAQWHLGGGRFQSGSVNAAYTKLANPGESFTAQLPGGLDLEAYAEAVTHTVSVSGGQIARDTSISFSRGVVAEPGGHADVRSTPFAELG